MAGKRIIAGLERAGGIEALLAQAHRLVFEGADELCLMGAMEPAAVRALVAHLDVPVLVWLPLAEPAQVEAMLRLGACRVWIEEPAAEAYAPLLTASGALRLGIHVDASSSTVAGALRDVGLCEVIAPLSLLRESDLAGQLSMHVVAEGRGEPLEAVADWLLSGGDAWLREPDSSVPIPAFKQALVRGGLRVRT